MKYLLTISIFVFSSGCMAEAYDYREIKAKPENLTYLDQLRKNEEYYLDHRITKIKRRVKFFYSDKYLESQEVREIISYVERQLDFSDTVVIGKASYPETKPNLILYDKHLDPPHDEEAIQFHVENVLHGNVDSKIINITVASYLLDNDISLNFNLDDFQNRGRLLINKLFKAYKDNLTIKMALKELRVIPHNLNNQLSRVKNNLNIYEEDYDDYKLHLHWLESRWRDARYSVNSIPDNEKYLLFLEKVAPADGQVLYRLSEPGPLIIRENLIDPIARKIATLEIQRSALDRFGLLVSKTPFVESFLVKNNIANGVGVRFVHKDSPADKAGLRNGRYITPREYSTDIIISINNKSVSTVQDVVDIILANKAARSFVFSVWQDGKISNRKLTLMEMESGSD